MQWKMADRREQITVLETYSYDQVHLQTPLCLFLLILWCHYNADDLKTKQNHKHTALRQRRHVQGVDPTSNKQKQQSKTENQALKQASIVTPSGVVTALGNGQ